MNFVENFNALFDQSFFVFLDTKLFEQALPRGAHGALTSLSLYLPKVYSRGVVFAPMTSGVFALNPPSPTKHNTPLKQTAC